MDFAGTLNMLQVAIYCADSKSSKGTLIILFCCCNDSIYEQHYPEDIDIQVVLATAHQYVALRGAYFPNVDSA